MPFYTEGPMSFYIRRRKTGGTLPFALPTSIFAWMLREYVSQSLKNCLLLCLVGWC